MDSKFILNKNTKIKFNGNITIAIINAVNILKRDMEKSFQYSNNYYEDEIIIDYSSENIKGKTKEESFFIKFDCNNSKKTMRIIASDELGIIYGILYISNNYLGVDPFWFFNDKDPERKVCVEIEMKDYTSSPNKVRYRGWFVNDEVLINGWKCGSESEELWRIIFETLLRCGGNMIIPGTDKKALQNRKLASEMGLYISHHHAEPLGAEMFLRVFPDKEPSYDVNSELFHKIWEDGVIAQKDMKVVWNVGFRGQGDCAFWQNDPRYKTNESRGKLISDVIKKQIDIVKKHIENPVFCTNIYGEIMELYKGGHVDIPDGVIKIWADNGYGKMVSRRQGTNNPRVYALPTLNDKKPSGLYYHVTFHDLQASNHLTMLPNSPEFVANELTNAFEAGADEYLIVNCGNIKPHNYMLGIVSEVWEKGKIDIKNYIKEYTEKYYPLETNKVQKCYEDYFTHPIEYGVNEDDKAGEEFYHYNARKIIWQWIKEKDQNTNKALLWATGDISFENQVKWYKSKCEEGMKSWGVYKAECLKVYNSLNGEEKSLFFDNIVVQSIIHDSGCRGAVELCIAYEEYKKNDYFNAYMHAQDSLKFYEEAIYAMKNAEHDKWKNYYKNDCLTNIKLTIYAVDSLRRYLRILGDGPVFNNWEKKKLFSDNDRHIMLQTAYFNQLTDDELYNKIKEKEIESAN